MPEPGPGADAEVFWAYALRTWEHVPTRDQLLEWQEHHDLDVMLLLFSRWYPGTLTTHDWRALGHLSERWKTRVIAPIRRLRQRLRPTAPAPRQQALYRTLLELELKAERSIGEQFCRQAAHRQHRSGRIDVPRRIRLLFPALPASESCPS